MNQDAPATRRAKSPQLTATSPIVIRVDSDTEPARLRRPASVSQFLYGRSTADQRKYESEDNADDSANPR